MQSCVCSSQRQSRAAFERDGVQMRRCGGKLARNRLNRPWLGLPGKSGVPYGIGSLLSQEGEIGINPGGNSLIFDLVPGRNVGLLCKLNRNANAKRSSFPILP